MMKMLMMLSALLTAPALFAQVELNEEPAAPPPPRSGFKMDRQRPMLNPEMIKKFDKDGDGKLSREERQAIRQSMPSRTDSSYAINRPMNRGKRQLPPEMIQKFDKDGDGTLSQEERQAMRAEFQKMMQTDSGRKMMGERMNRREGRRGPRGESRQFRGGERSERHPGAEGRLDNMPPPPPPAEEEAGL